MPGDSDRRRSVTIDLPGAFPQVQPNSIVGRVLGEFLVTAAVEISAGVYRAAQRSLGREAIVKVLPAGDPPADSLVQKFLLETQLAARLDHPYAAHTYASGAEPDGLLWIAMELVRGTPLDVFISAQGRLSPERFVPFIQRLAEVVDAAHEAGIVHRDIKPENVMAVARAGALFPKLLDFGVAAVLEEVGHAEVPRGGSARRMVGSPRYLAPEQWSRMAQPMPQSDLYSLAVLSFEVLSGRVPFDGPSLDVIAEAHATAPVPALDPERSSPIDDVLRRALAKDPKDRYPTAQAFAEALRAVTVRSSRRLPQLPLALRDAYVVAAPRPLAECVVDIADAEHPHQALDAIAQLLSIAVRVVGLVALAARLVIRRARDGQTVRDLLRALRTRSLSDQEWLELAQGLTAPHAAYRDAYPLPELIDLLAKPTAFDALLALRSSLSPPSAERAVESLERALPLAATLLEALRFLEGFPIIVRRAGGIEEWMGIRRGRRTPTPDMARESAECTVALASCDGAILLELSPLIQVHRPLPSHDEELFLLDGSDGPAARLVVQRTGFALSDGELWNRIESVLSLDDPAGDVVAERAEQSPYLGLAAFSASEASIFVGREREIETFLNRLRVQSFVGVVGPSGAGKSSFIGAGVIPALPSTWRAVLVRPGPTPIDALAARLAREGLCGVDLRAALAADPDALVTELRRHAGTGAIVLVVDQFEEVFTLCRDEAERASYADALARAARSVDEPLRVVITLRDDFLVRVEQLPALRDRLSQGFHLLSTPAAADLIRILVEPARGAGYEFDDMQLPAEMVAQVADQPGALALLSFTGMRLWEMRDRYFRRLTRRAYLEMGGVGGALARHAESMLALLTLEEWAMVRLAFRRLITSEGTRAVVQRTEMVQALGGGAAERVIERLVSARLLVASDADFGHDQLEVIHEALLGAWPRLVEWRRDDAEGARLRDQLGVAARQWQRRGRPRGLLWRDDALAEYRVWRTRFPAGLSDVEAAFAKTCLAAARSGRIRRQLLIGGALTVLAAGSLVLALSERRVAENARQAEQQVAILNEEKGREALFAGDPSRAIVYLNEAMRRGRDGPRLRYPLATATRELSREIFTLEHGARVWDAAFSPVGDWVATGGDDGDVRLWDGRTGALQRTMHGHLAEISMLAFNGDGSLLATASADGTARVWDVESGTVRRTFDGHGSKVRYAAFLRGGKKRLLTADDAASVRIWDVDAPGSEATHTFTTHVQPLWSAQLSPDGGRLVTASSDGTARIWSVETGQELARLDGHRGPVVQATFSPDGRTVATASDDRTVRLWDAASGRLLFTSPVLGQVMYLVTFFPDGKRVLAGGGDKVTQVWSVPDGRLEMSLVGHTGYLNAIDVSATGDFIATASSDGTARLWNGTTGQPVATLYGHVGAVWRVRFDATGDRLITAGHDGFAKVWNARQVDGVLLRGHTDEVLWAGFSLGGQHVLTTGRDETARVWDAANGQLLDSHFFERKSPFGDVTATWDRAGERLLICEDNGVRVIDVSSERSVNLEYRGALKYATFSDDAARVITAGDDGAKLWDTSTGRLLGSYPFHAVWVGAVALSPDNRSLATVVNDHDIQIIDVESQSTVAYLSGKGLGFGSLEFSADGHQLLSGGQDWTANVWDIKRQTLALSLEGGHHSDIVSAHFSPDGTRIVTVGADGVANVWDGTTGDLLIKFSGTLALNWAGFSPDGKRLVVAGDDRIARIWTIEMETRSAAEIMDFARCHSPFRLEESRMVRRTIDRSKCEKH